MQQLFLTRDIIKVLELRTMGYLVIKLLQSFSSKKNIYSRLVVVFPGYLTLKYIWVNSV